MPGLRNAVTRSTSPLPPPFLPRSSAGRVKRSATRKIYLTTETQRAQRFRRASSSLCPLCLCGELFLLNAGCAALTALRARPLQPVLVLDDFPEGVLVDNLAGPEAVDVAALVIQLLA